MERVDYNNRLNTNKMIGRELENGLDNYYFSIMVYPNLGLESKLV